MQFYDRGDIVSSAKPKVTIHPVKAMSVILGAGQDGTQYITNELLLSCPYWILDVTSSTSVEYLTPGSEVEATPMGQQGVGFAGLGYLMGLVKDPTTENKPACLKRWAAGLAGVHRTSMLSESATSAIWKFIVDNKAILYSYPGVREDLITAYLRGRDSRASEPAIVRAVLSQLDLVYTDAYLKSVNLMSMFSTSGSRALEIPAVVQEAINLDTVLERVRTAEGPNYSMCRLLDNSRYPELNHAHYPNLYSATLEWARRTHKVQKNYLGSKTLLDQALHRDIVKKVLKMTTSTLGTAELTQEQKTWLEAKGYRMPSTPLHTLLMEMPVSSHRRRHAESSSEDSDTETETDEKVKRARRK